MKKSPAQTKRVMKVRLECAFQNTCWCLEETKEEYRVSLQPIQIAG